MRILTIKTQVSDSVFLKLEQAPKEMRRGLKDAVNEMARQTGEDIRVDVYQKYALKSGRFKKGNVKLKKATVSKAVAKITISGNPISLKSGYRTRKNGIRKGGQTQVEKTGGFKELKKGGSLKAFVTTAIKKDSDDNERSYTNLFQRKGKERYPIKAFHGPGQAKLAEMVFRDMKAEKEDELKRRIFRLAERIMQ